ncbi:calcitonin gene-related peptide type 1 receptor-like [Ruditapes philippinarum]|uniref:calcitonin gene-related peptide type 1 receptor-like n=1 Tax=Ruditapes philippinarum TaxID=129788 RepID=UPI00295B6C73|nr:calcitonin gene-related peptide type 1 receptor-like [Ruditapes philippinarum]
MVCNFLWMFCEGLYLNTIMVYALSSGKILIFSCNAIGWGLPVIFTTIYAVIRSNDEVSSSDCWLDESSLQWIVYGPIVLSIGVNVLFLINIVRLLITKLRQMPEADQTRKATRATQILVPLLGLQYLLFPIRSDAGSDLEDVYHVAVALLVSLQGAFVSLMYCFCNSEVIQVLRRRWNQHKLMHRSSMRTSANHGTTYTTMDPVTQTNRTYCSTVDHKDPPIEMTTIDENK